MTTAYHNHATQMNWRCAAPRPLRGESRSVRGAFVHARSPSISMLVKTPIPEFERYAAVCCVSPYSVQFSQRGARYAKPTFTPRALAGSSIYKYSMYAQISGRGAFLLLSNLSKLARTLRKCQGSALRMRFMAMGHQGLRF
nr:hypothetical protein CFP56_13366 [Quercus suber]